MEDKYQNLYSRISKTADSRFFASHRMNRHKKMTLWSISISSSILVVFPLFSVFSIQLNYPSNIIEFAQIVFAIIVLVYSILLSTQSNTDRSEKMHRCALEINNLSQEIVGLLNTEFNEATYNENLKKYHDIINRYDNHDPIDFEFTKLKRKQDFQIQWYERIFIYFKYSLGFVHYFIIVLAELLFLIYSVI